MNPECKYKCNAVLKFNKDGNIYEITNEKCDDCKSKIPVFFCNDCKRVREGDYLCVCGESIHDAN